MGQISEQQVQQLMKLRELMLADMSSKQSYQAAIIQKQATSEAARKGFSIGRRRYLMEPNSNPAGSEEYEGSVSRGFPHRHDRMFGFERTAQPDCAKGGGLRAGSLAGTSLVAVQDWFGKHRDCAVAVDAMCKPVREKAPAQWTDSTEGRVCVAARNTAQWVRKPSDDREKFQSGWK